MGAPSRLERAAMSSECAARPQVHLLLLQRPVLTSTAHQLTGQARFTPIWEQGASQMLEQLLLLIEQRWK
jgi:hypothetical protein